MRIAVFLILLLCTVQITTAQNKLTGRVVDALNKLPLPDATVTLINPADSAAMGFAVVDKTGLFEIRNLSKGSFILGITFTGYQHFTRHLDITQTQFVMDLDTVFMEMDTAMMAGVIVTAPPIKVNKDTVEFRASAFKTKPNATVEDLLKKLPGVEVDKSGTVTAQGEEITKIYVDGKEFFSNDPKLATKNLSSDMVESIQVFDDMSDQAKFTKMDDGSRKRTINIKLKKDRKKGMFGRANGAIGTSDRYNAGASFNIFNDKQQISVLGSANNVNQPGFSSSDLTGASPGGGRGGGSSPGANSGNTKTWSTGINFRDEWGRKVTFAGNYFVSNTNTSTYTNSYRQSVFGTDSASYTTSESSSSNIGTNHRLGFRLEYFMDTMNSFLVTPAITLQKSTSNSDQYQNTRATNAKVDYRAIQGESHRSTLRDAEGLTSDMLFRHRFHKQGRTFTIGWTTALNASDGNGNNTSPYYFYNDDSTLNRLDDRRQQNEQIAHSFNNTISTSITEMIDSNKILELNYAYIINKSTSDQDTWDYRASTGLYDSVDLPQTNYFRNLFTANRFGTNFRVKKEKYDFQLGGAVHFASLENMSHRAMTGKDSTMRQHYTNFFPNASFNFNPKPRTSLRFGYRGSTKAPTIAQLQDVVDVSNSLSWRTGNPNLKQEFTHALNLSYNKFNFTNFVYMNVTMSGNIVSNKIVNNISLLSNGVQLIRPENLNGAYNVSLSGTLGIPLKKVTTGKRSPLNINFTTNARYNRDVSMLQDTMNYNYTRSAGERIHFTYFIDNKLDVTASANFNYNDARYSVQKSMNYKYFDQHYAIDVTYTAFKRMMINNDFDYYINTGRAQGFNQPIPLWNASVSWLLFKKMNGEIKLSGFDLLNQNKAISRTVGDNYVEDSYTRILQRYFLVSFMYNFNQFGGKKGRGNGNDNGSPRVDGFRRH